MEAIKKYLLAFVAMIWTFVKGLWGGCKGAVLGLVVAVLHIVSSAISAVEDFLKGVLLAIKTVFDMIIANIKTSTGYYEKQLQALRDKIIADAKKYESVVGEEAKKVEGEVVSEVKTIVAEAASAAEKAAEAVKAAV